MGIEIRRGPNVLKLGEAPLQQVTFDPITSRKIDLHILRGDLIHPLISGNKAWKLRDNLREAVRLQKHQLVTFGGAFSNHLLAVAWAAHELKFDSVGILRGEESFSNPLLEQVQKLGMRLIKVSRADYREKHKIIRDLGLDHADAYILAEGGTNSLALGGCSDALPTSPAFDHIILPVGTGGTLAGFAIGAAQKHPGAQVHGIAVLKGAEYINKVIEELAPSLRNWTLHHNCHCGGYARSNPALDSLITEFGKKTQVRLEPTYGGKALYGMLGLIEEKGIREGDRILFVHTGGLYSRELNA